LNVLEGIRHSGATFVRPVNGYRDQKCPVVGHVVRAVDRKPPLAAEVTLVTRLGMSRDDRDEQAAVVNPLANLPIPGVSAAKLALVEPDFNPGGAQGLANPLGSLCIL
jgi:hypothetical protein